MDSGRVRLRLHWGGAFQASARMSLLSSPTTDCASIIVLAARSIYNREAGATSGGKFSMSTSTHLASTPIYAARSTTRSGTRHRSSICALERRCRHTSSSPSQGRTICRQVTHVCNLDSDQNFMYDSMCAGALRRVLPGLATPRDTGEDLPGQTLPLSCSARRMGCGCKVSPQ